MDRQRGWGLIVALLLLSSGTAFSQQVRRQTLVVNGRAGEAMVYEINGRSFIELEAVARIGAGSLSFQTNQIVLSLPAASGTAAPATAGPAQASDIEFSEQFMRAAIQHLATIENWRNTLAYAVQRGLPGDGARLVVYRDKASETLRLAVVAASRESERNALQLLTRNFNNLEQWYNKLVEGRKRMDSANYSMASDALDTDPLYQKILGCSKALGTMLPSGRFTSDASCE